jgi:hypothetical protein
MYGLWSTTELWVLIENGQCLRKNSWYFTSYGLWGLSVKTVTTVLTKMARFVRGYLMKAWMCWRSGWVGGKMACFTCRWLQPQAVYKLDSALCTLQGKWHTSFARRWFPSGCRQGVQWGRILFVQTVAGKSATRVRFRNPPKPELNPNHVWIQVQALQKDQTEPQVRFMARRFWTHLVTQWDIGCCTCVLLLALFAANCPQKGVSRWINQNDSR